MKHPVGSTPLDPHSSPLIALSAMHKSSACTSLWPIFSTGTWISVLPHIEKHIWQEERLSIFDDVSSLQSTTLHLLQISKQINISGEMEKGNLQEAREIYFLYFWKKLFDLTLYMYCKLVETVFAMTPRVLHFFKQSKIDFLARIQVTEEAKKTVYPVKT